MAFIPSGYVSKTKKGEGLMIKSNGDRFYISLKALKMVLDGALQFAVIVKDDKSERK